MPKRAAKTETEDEGVVFDPFTAPAPTKAVVLAAVYTDIKDVEHEADTTVELDRDEADRLLHAGLARTEEQDAAQQAELAELEAAQSSEPSGSSEETGNTNPEGN